MRSLKVRPASLLSSIRYSKLVISPCFQLGGGGGGGVESYECVIVCVCVCCTDGAGAVVGC